MSKGDRELVWADCFNAKKLDTEFWNPLPHMGGSDIERKMDASTCEMRDGSIFLTSYKENRRIRLCVTVFSYDDRQNGV